MLKRFGAIAMLAILTGGAPLAARDYGMLPRWIGSIDDMEPGQIKVAGSSSFHLFDKAAGLKQPDGWYRIHSTEGGYDVEFPLPSIDATVSSMDGDRHFVQGMITVESDTTRYVVFCMHSPDVEYPPTILDTYLNGMHQEMSDISSKLFTRGKLSGLEFNGIRQDKVYIHGQMFLLDRHRMCLMMIGSNDHFPEDAQRSFESFRATPVPASPAGKSVTKH
jgi:hypothetical protein